MELNQKIFQRLYNAYISLVHKSDQVQDESAVFLEPLKPRLTIIARALTGYPVNILTSEREGGWKDDNFYLPEKINFSAELSHNTDFYLFRTVYLAQMFNMRINADCDLSISDAQKLAMEASDQILDDLFKEFPSFLDIFKGQEQNIIDYFRAKNVESDLTWLFGRLMRNSPDFSAVLIHKDSKIRKGDEITTELEAKPSDDVRVIKIDHNQQENYVLTHNFEKVETLDEFNGNWRDFDGSDDLEEQEEALRELNLRNTVRVDDPVHSVYKSEFSGGIVDVKVKDPENNADQVIHYDEWNYRKKAYLRDYCTLTHKKDVLSVDGYCQSILQKNRKEQQKLKKMFAQVSNSLQQVSRLTSGEQIDFDAWLDAYVEIHSRRSPDDRFYTEKLKRKKDISILILLDTSLSTDGYAAGNKVIDVEREAAVMFGEVLEDYGIPFQIDTFSSRTRNNAIYTTVKGFKESWINTRNRLGAIQPQNYTRIGTALRHAGQMLNQQPAQKKWILMFSDGKPNDFDKYEGKYGIEDVKQALRELNGSGIQTFSFAIESTARYYLPLMFGVNQYKILSNPSEIPAGFAQFYKKAVQ